MSARGHRKKISFADLKETFDRAAPMNYPGTAHVPAAYRQQPTAAQEHEQRQRREEARRLSRRPQDRSIPDELSEVVVGDGVERYKQLRDVERRLDAVMMQKRVEVMESLNWPSHTEGTLRIWISNTAEGQPWQVMEEGGGGLGEDGTFDFGENSQATFRVKIEGKLLDDGNDEDKEETEKDGDAMDQDGQPAKPKTPAKERMRLSHFFKSITVDFHRSPSLQPDGFTSIDWRKPDRNAPGAMSAPDNNAADFDCLEFQRKSDEDINVTINLELDYQPVHQRFRLPKGLADLLDMQVGYRAEILERLWDYIRAFGLQEEEEMRTVVCDEPLKAVFGVESFSFTNLTQMVHGLITPLPPIKLPYTIRVDRDYIAPTDLSIPASRPTIYDIRVPLPSPLKSHMRGIRSSHQHMTTLQSLNQIDSDLVLVIEKIQHVNAKRKFYDSLARDPASFVKRWISSQKRDLEVILAEGGRGNGDVAEPGEEFRRGGNESVWNTPLAKEAVGLHLARSQKAL